MKTEIQKSEPKKRIIWKRAEIALLLKAFSQDTYITDVRAIELAKVMDRPVRAIKTWFRNKRRNRAQKKLSSVNRPKHIIDLTSEEIRMGVHIFSGF